MKRVRWALGLAISAGLALATAGPGWAAGPPPPPGGGPATVVLPTGDQVTVTTRAGGTTTGALLPASTSGPGAVLVHLGLGGHSYEVPADAIPYLGRGLDLRLFDLDALQGAENGGQLPVQVTYEGTLPALPGVTVTDATAGSADGYLTPASARSFGAALAKQFLADRARHGYGGQGLFANGVSIAMAGASPTGPTPQFVMHTLTLSASDSTGRPDEGDVAIAFNVDDSGRFGDPFESINQFSAGSARFSVPDGHYAVLALFLDADAAGNVTALREVVNPELAISGDTTARLDAALATSQVTVRTPRPAVPQDGGFVVMRTPAAGSALYLDVPVASATSIWVAPTSRPVTIGQLRSYPYLRLTSPAGSGVPYEYQVQQATSGVIPSQRYVVRQGDLATIDTRYYSDVTSSGVRQQMGIFPFELGQFVARGVHPLDLPRHEIEYVTGDPSIVWFGGVAKSTIEFPGGFQAWVGAQYDWPHSYRGGERTREDWDRSPMHPAGQVNPLGPASSSHWAAVPMAVRAGDTLGILAYPFADNQPGHTGYGGDGTVASGSYELDENGTRLAGDGNQKFLLAAQATLAPTPSTIRLVYDATRSGPTFTLSTHVHTEWTWRSAHEQGVTLPDGYRCDNAKVLPPHQDCSVEPLLTLRYAVQDMALDGSVHAGLQVVDLTAGHLPLAAAAPITKAAVQFSTDDGATWHDAVVVPTGPASYRAIFPALDGPGWVTLRATASDAAGGQIADTIVRAYRVEGDA